MKPRNRLKYFIFGLPFLLGIVAAPAPAHALFVYFTNTTQNADKIVYFTNTTQNADKIVYFTKNQNQADDCIIFRTKTTQNADEIWYVTKNQNQASLFLYKSNTTQNISSGCQ